MRFGDPEDEHPWDNPEEEEEEGSEEDIDDLSSEGDTRPLTAYNAMAGCGSVAKSSAAEQVSVSGTSSKSSAVQGSVCGSNVMVGGGSVGDSSSVSGSNSAQGSISRSN
ncbi:unnamed protein product [Brassica oleracea]|uniref:Uncharacterized protein n=1 Tax=Brassica oleracea TaxID=3712 RepID=A0A3P6C4F0_BRAOL|nr:unnamed protein product [Brassica oleracea]